MAMEAEGDLDFRGDNERVCNAETISGAFSHLFSLQVTGGF